MHLSVRIERHSFLFVSLSYFLLGKYFSAFSSVSGDCSEFLLFVVETGTWLSKRMLGSFVLFIHIIYIQL